MVRIRVIRDAVRIVDVLESAGGWLSAQQFLVPIGSCRMFAALRFAQEQGLIVSRITGEGPARFKEYSLSQPGLKPIEVKLAAEGKGDRQ